MLNDECPLPAHSVRLFRLVQAQAHFATAGMAVAASHGLAVHRVTRENTRDNQPGRMPEFGTGLCLKSKFERILWLVDAGAKQKKTEQNGLLKWY